jgi:hypothetical protein
MVVALGHGHSGASSRMRKGIRPPPHGEAERIKIRYAIAILHNGLTINDR